MSWIDVLFHCIQYMGLLIDVSYYSVTEEMNSDFGMFTESWILYLGSLAKYKWNPKGSTLTLQETRSIHDSMNIPKIEV